MIPLIAFARSRSGAAAVEMALIAPFVMGMAVAGFMAWDSGMRKQNMGDALRVSSQYYMNGGQDDATARSMGWDAWQKRPQNASLAIDRVCECQGAGADCGVLCPTGAPPTVFVRMTAASSQPNLMFGGEQRVVEQVRVR